MSNNNIAIIRDALKTNGQKTNTEVTMCMQFYIQISVYNL